MPAHVEKETSSESERAVHGTAEAVADERQLEIVDGAQAAFEQPQHRVERVEDDGGIADQIEDAVVGPEDGGGVVELRREDPQRVGQVGGGEVAPLLPLGQRHAVGIGPLRLLPKRRERRLRRIEFVDEAEVVPEVGNAEVEARRVLLDVVVVGLQVGLAVLDALLRRRGGRELVPDRHVGRHLPGHLYRVAGDREGGQLAGVGPHEVLRRRGGAGWPVELDDQSAVLDRCLPVLDEHAELGGKLQLRAVDGDVDTE